jgi:hypothetical protein
MTDMSAKLFEFNGAIRNFQTFLEINEDDEARLRNTDYLKSTLERCEEALNIIKNFIEMSGFMGQHLVGPKFDPKLKASLKALEVAKELFILALHADQQ